MNMVNKLVKGMESLCFIAGFHERCRIKIRKKIIFTILPIWLMGIVYILNTGYWRTDRNDFLMFLSGAIPTIITVPLMYLIPIKNKIICGLVRGLLGTFIIMLSIAIIWFLPKPSGLETDQNAVDYILLVLWCLVFLISASLVGMIVCWYLTLGAIATFIVVDYLVKDNPSNQIEHKSLFYGDRIYWHGGQIPETNYDETYFTINFGHALTYALQIKDFNIFASLENADDLVHTGKKTIKIDTKTRDLILKSEDTNYLLYMFDLKPKIRLFNVSDFSDMRKLFSIMQSAENPEFLRFAIKHSRINGSSEFAQYMSPLTKIDWLDDIQKHFPFNRKELLYALRNCIVGNRYLYKGYINLVKERRHVSFGLFNEHLDKLSVCQIYSIKLSSDGSELHIMEMLTEQPIEQLDIKLSRAFHCFYAIQNIINPVEDRMFGKAPILESVVGLSVEVKIKEANKHLDAAIKIVETLKSAVSPLHVKLNRIQRFFDDLGHRLAILNGFVNDLKEQKANWSEFQISYAKLMFVIDNIKTILNTNVSGLEKLVVPRLDNLMDKEFFEELENAHKPVELASIGKNLANAGSELRSLLIKIWRANRPHGLLAKRGEPYKERTVEEEDIEGVYKIFKNFKESLESAKEQLDKCKDNNISINAALINRYIEDIRIDIEGSNLTVEFWTKRNSWFNKSQGSKKTLYKKAQLAYRDYYECVVAYYKLTDVQHEKTKASSDSQLIVMKAPEIKNLMTAKTLKSLKGFKLEGWI